MSGSSRTTVIRLSYLRHRKALEVDQYGRISSGLAQAALHNAGTLSLVLPILFLETIVSTQTNADLLAATAQ
jgi:hypothetical protein